MKSLLPILIIFAGCGDGVNAPLSEPNRSTSDAWAVWCSDANANPVYLANHGFGVRISPMGFSLTNCLVMESGALYSGPKMGEFGISLDGVLIEPKHVVAYDGNLNFKTGELRAHYHCVVPSGAAIEVVVRTVVEPYSALLAQQIEITSAKNEELVFTSDVGNQKKASYSNEYYLEGEVVVPIMPVSNSDSLGNKNRLARWKTEIANSSIAESSVNGTMCKIEARVSKDTLTLTRIVVLDSIEEQKKPLPTFAEVSQRVKSWWAKKWQTDIIIDGPIEDQQAIRSFLFNLYQSECEKLPPMGFSSSKYNGHRFWDAETWMLPVYSLISREFAGRATRWRTGVAPFAWESGVGGKDVTPAEFKDAIHINGWVAWWTEQAFALNLVSKVRRDAVVRSVSRFFWSRSKNNEIRQVVSPDEGKKRDNDLVTNLLAEWASMKSSPLRFRHIPYKIPYSPDGLPATFDNDPMKGYQQTAALLAIYPLNWWFADDVQNKMFDRYKGLTSEVGPAMSDSIHATIAARLGRNSEAYKFWRQSWMPFVHQPWLSFFERRNSSDDYFLTGAAGCLQSVIYGFLGIRFEEGKGKPPAPSKELANGYWLTVRPNIPAEWKSITFKGVQLPNGRVTIRASASGVTIQDGG